MKYSLTMFVSHVFFVICVLTIVALFAKLLFSMYADGECLGNGYRIAHTTFKGDIYCSFPFGERDHPVKINP